MRTLSLKFQIARTKIEVLVLERKNESEREKGTTNSAPKLLFKVVIRPVTFFVATKQIVTT